VLRWFKLISAGGALPQLDWFLYAVLLCLYVMVAGAVAVAFKPPNEWKALWVGASLPAIVAVLIQAAPPVAK
jgi:hypothetical protein